LNKMMYLQVGW